MTSSNAQAQNKKLVQSLLENENVEVSYLY